MAGLIDILYGSFVGKADPGNVHRRACCSIRFVPGQFEQTVNVVLAEKGSFTMGVFFDVAEDPVVLVALHGSPSSSNYDKGSLK